MRRVLSWLVLVVSAATVLAQDPPAVSVPAASASPAVAPTPYVPNASASPTSAMPSTSEMLENIGKLVKDGKLFVEADLIKGSMPLMPKYTFDVEGDPKTSAAPKTSMAVEATDGKVTHAKFDVEGGKLVVRGSGLRPKVAIEGFEFQDPQGITNLKFHGIGIWRPIVAIFRGIATSAVGKLSLRTDIPSVLKGEILGAKKAEAPKGATPPPAPTPTPPPAEAGGPPPSPTPSFMDLVQEVRLKDMVVTAFPARRMVLRPFVAFDTAANPTGEAMKVSIESATFRPGHGGTPNYVELSGHLEGEIENGEMEFEANRVTIAKGQIRAGAFEGKSAEDGKIASTFTAEVLAFELSSGKFVVPGGMSVELDEGSKFEVDKLRVTSAGKFSGLAKLDLAGKTGDLSRKGATLSASDIKLKTTGLTIVDGKATGPLEVSLDYQLEYPFVVKYPIEQLPEKKLMLDFHGPFATSLHLKDAGGDEGEVTGTYVFKAPWDPIEQAALAALEAKWRQDLAIKNIEFAITPKMFRPCGESCFTLSMEITAEKRSQNRLKKLFSQYCAPVTSASLVIDKEARAFLLKDVKVETHCKGALGWIVNFLAPLLTKTYTNLALFKMPPDLPLTIDSVRGGAKLVEIAGRVDWSASEQKPKVPPEPQPVVVEPEKPPIQP